MQTLVYKYFKTPIGRMIGGATARGMCFLDWVEEEDEQPYLEKVARKYHGHLVKRNSPILKELGGQLKAYFKRDLKKFKIKVDLTGTEFQKDVWKAMRKIPYGKTRSYKEIAETVGSPKASRAVGAAGGQNYLSLVIPCHRVIESSGKLSDYRGEVWRKQYLLDLEQNRILFD